jgi:monovalent cation/hydrogen antiporter
VQGAVPNSRRCEACVAAGDVWVQLRMCLTCGLVGCCDSSAGRHASAHAADAGHPVVRSVEPGEAWRWCYIDQVFV